MADNRTRLMLKMARVRVSVSVEILTMDGDNWAWSKVMDGPDTCVAGESVSDMDPETAAKYITESSRVMVENMLRDGYDPE